jgi:hypothetical protein
MCNERAGVEDGAGSAVEATRIELCLFHLEKQFMSARCHSFRNLCTSLFLEGNDQDCASASKSRQLAIA